MAPFSYQFSSENVEVLSAILLIILIYPTILVATTDIVLVGAYKKIKQLLDRLRAMGISEW